MTFFTGVVEGFYGRQWGWQERTAYAAYLAAAGLNSYLYCPKGDPFLRKQWWQPWPETGQAQLRQLAGVFRAHHLNWGVGLSPFALYENYSSSMRARLREKILRLDALGGNLLAILFDDMPGTCTELALRQAEIINDVMHWSAAEQVLVCPTYYSFDPQLERYFGARPAYYWQDLGAALPAEVEVMWTGNEVCSPVIDVTDVQAISALLGRAPLLWDNYPVNDGARASNYLHLDPLSGRSPALAQVVTGHLCNPMNQAWLSRLPLTGLATLYGASWLSPESLFSAALIERLEQDKELFQEVGLQGMSTEQKLQLAGAYAAIPDPAAAEVAAWLGGEYTFDPDCLTV